MESYFISMHRTDEMLNQLRQLLQKTWSKTFQGTTENQEVQEMLEMSLGSMGSGTAKSMIVSERAWMKVSAKSQLSKRMMLGFYSTMAIYDDSTVVRIWVRGMNTES